MKRNCDTCYNYILRRGLVSTMVCIEQDGEPSDPANPPKPEGNGVNCPCWHEQPTTMVNGKRVYRRW